jgi:hypothetical protein
MLFSLILSVGKAQTIAGIVVDDKNAPQPYVNVILLKTVDSTLVTGTTTNEMGKFEFAKIKSGSYLLKATSVGFLDFKKVINLNGNDAENIAITLQSNVSLLSEVVVKGKKTVIESQGDKLVFNVEVASNTVGLNGLEVLRKSPGITVDQNNNVMLRGRSKVQVYINGKPSMIEGNDLAAFLKSLSANDIAAIEMSTAPGAAYDAEGAGGVINIRLKKNLKTGLNGSFSATAIQGYTPKGDANLSLNYVDSKWNINGAVTSETGIYRMTEDVVNTTSTNNVVRLNSIFNENRKGLNLRLNTDYKLSKSHTIGARILNNSNTENNDGVSNTNIFTTATDAVPSLALKSLNTVHRETKIVNLGLNYRFDNEKGTKLGIDVDWNRNNNKSNTDQPNSYIDPSTNSLLYNRNYAMVAPVEIDIKMAKIDYELSLKKWGKLMTGAKYSTVQTNNSFNLFNVKNQEKTLDTSQTNQFNYTERIATGYVSINGKTGKWEYTVGLRLENTNTSSRLSALRQSQNRSVDSSYINLFPTLSAVYNLNENHSFSMAYRYSVDRPAYEDLNPFERRTDDFNSSRGNPFLRPQFTNTVELGYTFLQSINLTLNYSHTRDFAAMISDRAFNAITQRETFFETTRNLAVQEQYGINLSFPVTITKWWQGFANVYSNYKIFNANLETNKSINRKVLSGGLWMQQQMTFGKGWSFDLSGWYVLNDSWGISVSKPMGVFDAGLTKKILKDKGTIKFSFNDLFKGSGWKSEAQVGNFTTFSNGTWEGQTIALNFTYRFGLLKSDAKTNVEGDSKKRGR